MTRSSNHPDADYTPNDMGPPEHRFSFEELAYRKEFMQKIAEGRDPEIEMIQEKIDWYHDQETNKLLKAPL